MITIVHWHFPAQRLFMFTVKKIFFYVQPYFYYYYSWKSVKTSSPSIPVASLVTNPFRLFATASTKTSNTVDWFIFPCQLAYWVAFSLWKLFLINFSEAELLVYRANCVNEQNDVQKITSVSANKYAINHFHLSSSSFYISHSSILLKSIELTKWIFRQNFWVQGLLQHGRAKFLFLLSWLFRIMFEFNSS